MTRARAIVVTVAIAASLTGCGRAAGPSAKGPQSSTPTTASATQTPVQQDGTQAGRVARDYALAARSWTPDSYRAQYDRQLELSTGQLRHSLKRLPPSNTEIRQFRKDKASLHAQVQSIQRRRETPTEALYSVVLSERSVAVDETMTQRTINSVELQRSGKTWKVSGFTVIP